MKFKEVKIKGIVMEASCGPNHTACLVKDAAENTKIYTWGRNWCG